MSYGDGVPVLNGVALKRPTTADRAPEQVGADVVLANGSTRRYDQGERQVFALAWARMTEDELAALRAAATRGAVDYVDLDGESYTVLVDGRPSASPIGATSPVLFAVSLTLREQSPQG